VTCNYLYLFINILLPLVFMTFRLLWTNTIKSR